MLKQSIITEGWISHSSRRKLRWEVHATVQSERVRVKHWVKRVPGLSHASQEHPVCIHDLGCRRWLHCQRRLCLHAQAHLLAGMYGMLVEGLCIWTGACRMIARVFIEHVSRCIVLLLYNQEVSAGLGNACIGSGEEDDGKSPTKLLNMRTEGRCIVSG